MPPKPESTPETGVRPFRDYVAAAAETLASWRPFSFYLLFAVLIVMVLGLGMVYVRDDPKKFAFYLSLLFVFFFVVIARAIVDCFDIWRRHFAENERLFRDTLGEETFVGELGKRVERGREPR